MSIPDLLRQKTDFTTRNCLLLAQCSLQVYCIIVEMNSQSRHFVSLLDNLYMLIAFDVDANDPALATAGRPLVHMFMHSIRITAYPDNIVTGRLQVVYEL